MGKTAVTIFQLQNDEIRVAAGEMSWHTITWVFVIRWICLPDQSYEKQSKRNSQDAGVSGLKWERAAFKKVHFWTFVEISCELVVLSVFALILAFTLEFEKIHPPKTWHPQKNTNALWWGVVSWDLKVVKQEVFLLGRWVWLQNGFMTTRLHCTKWWRKTKTTSTSCSEWCLLCRTCASMWVCWVLDNMRVLILISYAETVHRTSLKCFFGQKQALCLWHLYLCINCRVETASLLVQEYCSTT